MHCVNDDCRIQILGLFVIVTSFLATSYFLRRSDFACTKKPERGDNCPINEQTNGDTQLDKKKKQ